MEKECASYLEKHELNKSARRILTDSLLLASNIIEGRKNVFELVSKNIVDKDDELVKCVGILSDLEKNNKEIVVEDNFFSDFWEEEICGDPNDDNNDEDIIKHEIQYYEDLRNIVKDVFKTRYKSLQDTDFFIIVADYRAIRNWMIENNTDTE